VHPDYEREVGEDYVTGTDIKNWIYCPLIVYYRKIMKAPIAVKSQQKEGKTVHEEELKRIIRRVGLAARKKKLDIIEKIIKKRILIEEESLYGEIDLVIKTRSKEIIPVELKNTQSNKGKPWPDHRYQLAYYAILLEKETGKIIKRGCIYYIPENRLVEIIITNHEKNYVRKIIEKIKEMMKTEKPPKQRIHPRKCTGGCGYKWICKP